MSSTKSTQESSFKALFAAIVIPTALVVSWIIYKFILGAPGNFDAEGHPVTGNYLGVIYMGGPIVPILITVNLLVLTFSIERFITISKAKGSARVEPFIRNVKNLMGTDKIDAAMAECDKQKGSIAAVIKAGLGKYKYVENDNTMDKEGKIAAIQKELEEATSLELPMLSKNLVIISTCASIATLIGLIGTVLGMIRAFAALAQAGAPDATALATGISEALINTALGIIGSTIAIIMYNYFTNKIDTLTYGIDEAGFSIVQTFNEKHKA
ncbi:MAG: MotA/TolQ/ExbB proton channel family protein [Bacteroidetes bacterium]|nr:MotA/TolQ/ExbB proton channel family protein [Bacteroidota bacterium]